MEVQPETHRDWQTDRVMHSPGKSATQRRSPINVSVELESDSSFTVCKCQDICPSMPSQWEISLYISVFISLYIYKPQNILLRISLSRK